MMLYAVNIGPPGLSDSQLSQCKRSSLALGETSRGFATVFLQNRSQHCFCIYRSLLRYFGPNSAQIALAKSPMGDKQIGCLKQAQFDPSCFKNLHDCVNCPG